MATIVVSRAEGTILKVCMIKYFNNSIQNIKQCTHSSEILQLRVPSCMGLCICPPQYDYQRTYVSSMWVHRVQ